MALGTLTGYTIKATLPMGAFGDHTYVGDNLGRFWGCAGRSAGGVAICSGPGNIDKADCLAQSSGTAGITWGIDGVCHQMSNRILSAATPPLFVSKARGYRFAAFQFGIYGNDGITGAYSPILNPWPELKQCNAGHTHP